MICRSLLLLLLCGLLCTNVAFAQHTQFYFSPHAATQGFGAELKFVPQPGLNIRGGASLLHLKFNTSYTVREEPADARVKVDLANLHLMFDVHPFISSTTFARKFLLTAGMAYFWEDEGNAIARYKGTYHYEGLEMAAEEVGELYGNVAWKKAAPFLGFGFENPHPRNKVNIGFALGAYYMGKPEVTVTGTKYLTDTESDEAEFRENVSNFRFLPVLQLNLNIAL
ncbi:hypothetical protein [Pedobacter sp.]|uniref:hypothetical protein n=1 Tax=Pedobacter sp. TaxID=1411316 RepID=UPI003D7FD331